MSVFSNSLLASSEVYGIFDGSYNLRLPTVSQSIFSSRISVLIIFPSASVYSFTRLKSYVVGLNSFQPASNTSHLLLNRVKSPAAPPVASSSISPVVSVAAVSSNFRIEDY